jgi:GNAT superfamily N-acetyltransferase
MVSSSEQNTIVSMAFSDPTVAIDEPASVEGSLIQGLLQYNEAFLGPANRTVLAASARLSDGTLIGGVTGRVIYECLMIELVWVAEEYRGCGLGSRLLTEIEAEAHRRGASKAFLDTFDFQAAPFYEKHGYVEAARVKGFFDSRDRIYMTKARLFSDAEPAEQVVE